MRVWLVQTTGEPLPISPDARLLRTGRHAQDLAAAGHDVVWWASTFDHDSKMQIAWGRGRRGVATRFDLQLLYAPAYRKNVSLRRYVADVMVARSFRRQARHLVPPDVIVASMPSYFVASEAVAYARGRGIPIVVDVRDAWPAIFLDALPASMRPLARLALAPDRRRVRALLRDATALTSMMESLLDWALQQGGRPHGEFDKVFHLGAPKLLPADPAMVSAPVRYLIERLRGRFVVAYVGAFGHFTDPRVIVAAARIINASNTARARFSFVLAGTGPSAEELRRSSSDLANVHFTGQLAGNDVAAVLSAASVGVVPSPRGHDAMPNKFFTYLAAGLPVLGSPAGEMRDILVKGGAGLAFAAGDPASLADLIRRLESRPEERERMARAARALFDDQFESSKLNARFVRYLEELAARGPVLA